MTDLVTQPPAIRALLSTLPLDVLSRENSAAVQNVEKTGAYVELGECSNGPSHTVFGNSCETAPLGRYGI